MTEQASTIIAMYAKCYSNKFNPGVIDSSTSNRPRDEDLPEIRSVVFTSFNCARKRFNIKAFGFQVHN